MKILGIISCMTLILACLANNSGLQELNLSSFKISVPKEWRYIKQQGEDSFVGEIKISKSTSLNFDCSGMGYANHLLQTSEEYIQSHEWWDNQLPFSYRQANNNLRIPSISEKEKYGADIDYIDHIIYNNRNLNIPIIIPKEIKLHHFQIDSTDKYVTKTIWPKVPGKGMTGIYIHSRTSNFNFQMSGRNLSEKDKNSALQVFKTIKFK